MAQVKITDLQQISAMTDGSALPVDNGIQTYRVTGSQLKTYFAPIYCPPSIQKFTSGSGTYNKSYSFIVSGVSASAGATYTHNSVTYTVLNTVSSSGIIVLNGSAAPLSSGTLTKASGTGDATISFSAFKAPLFLKVRMVGGGGGGGANGSSGSPTGGVAGGTTTFGTSLLTSTGGSAGSSASGGGGGNGGAGGNATINSPAYGTGLPGGVGSEGSNTASGGQGGAGGSNFLGGFGGGAGFGHAGFAAATNSGGGGGGAGGGSSFGAAGGGGASASIDAIIPDPSATYSYAVGSSGAGGSVGGGNGYAGGAGAAGYIEVTEYYQ